MNEIKPVRVTWMDSTGYPGWCSLENTKDFTPASMESIGWLIRSDDDAVVLAMSLTCEDSRAGDLLVIPTKCVTNLEFII